MLGAYSPKTESVLDRYSFSMACIEILDAYSHLPRSGIQNIGEPIARSWHMLRLLETYPRFFYTASAVATDCIMYFCIVGLSEGVFIYRVVCFLV